MYINAIIKNYNKLYFCSSIIYYNNSNSILSILSILSKSYNLALKLSGSERSISASLVNVVHLILTQTSAARAARIRGRTAFRLEFVIGKKEQFAFRQRNRSSDIVFIRVQAILVAHSGRVPFCSLNPTHRIRVVNVQFVIA